MLLLKVALISGLCFEVLGQVHSEAEFSIVRDAVVAKWILSSIAILPPGASPPTAQPPTTVVEITTSDTSTTPTTPTSTSKTTSTSSTTTIKISEHGLVLSTTFTQPTQCRRDFMTSLAADPDVIWNIAIDSEIDGGYTTCLPSQFYSSVLATQSGTPLPPFSTLVCPYGWESYNLNSTYVICCPSGYGLFQPDASNTERPGLDAVCISDVWPDELMDVTSYDFDGRSTVIPTSAPSDGTVVLAYAFDGIAATPFSITSDPATVPLSSASLSRISSTHQQSSVPVSSVSSLASTSSLTQTHFATDTMRLWVVVLLSLLASLRSF